MAIDIGEIIPDEELQLDDLQLDVGVVYSDKNYVHRQDVASDEWEISHNLDKYPSVSVVDSAGNIIYGNVHYISLNLIKIYFKSAFTGRAYLN